MRETIPIPQQYRPLNFASWTESFMSGRQKGFYAKQRIRALAVRSQLILGEKCLDHARRQLSPEQATPILALAREALQSASTTTPRGPAEHLTRSAARLRLSEFPLLSSLILKDALPHPDQAFMAYQRDANLITGLVQNTRLLPANAYGAAKGPVAELAARLLVNRYAHRKGISNEWYSFKSFMSDDMGCGQATEVRNNWDLSLWTSSDVDRVLPTYRVQVKYSEQSIRSADKQYDPGITVLKVHPGLALRDELADSLPYQILEDVQLETFVQHGAARKRLDARTEQLLDILG